MKTVLVTLHVRAIILPAQAAGRSPSSFSPVRQRLLGPTSIGMVWLSEGLTVRQTNEGTVVVLIQWD